jgi:hypothetical protein
MYITSEQVEQILLVDNERTEFKIAARRYNLVHSLASRGPLPLFELASIE